MAYLECKDLSLGYDGEALASNINFKVEAGNYLYIIGENGTGKSTLMKTILGLQKPISGQILFDDGLNSGEIGYLPQQTIVQKDFPASVREIVLSGCQKKQGLIPFYNKKNLALARRNMKLLGIEDLEKRCYRELSGGQQQRVLLARALCATKKILLLDEPVSGLDPLVTTEMYQLIENLNKKRNISIIMISHDIEAAKNYASHILNMGNEIFFGSKEDFLKTNAYKKFQEDKND